MSNGAFCLVLCNPSWGALRSESPMLDSAMQDMVPYNGHTGLAPATRARQQKANWSMVLSDGCCKAGHHPVPHGRGHRQAQLQRREPDPGWQVGAAHLARDRGRGTMPAGLQEHQGAARRGQRAHLWRPGALLLALQRMGLERSMSGLLEAIHVCTVSSLSEQC